MAEYNAEKRRFYYLKYREKILKRQKEYDDAHRPQINKRMRKYYRIKCGLKAEKKNGSQNGNQERCKKK